MAGAAWQQMTEVQKDDFGSEEDQEINSKSRKKMKISKTISKTHAFDGRRRVDVSDKDTLNHRRYLAEKNEIKLVYNLPKKPIQPALAWAYGDGSSFLKAKFPNMRSTEVMAYANEEFPQHAVRAVRAVPTDSAAPPNPPNPPIRQFADSDDSADPPIPPIPPTADSAKPPILLASWMAGWGGEF